MTCGLEHLAAVVGAMRITFTHDLLCGSQIYTRLGGVVACFTGGVMFGNPVTADCVTLSAEEFPNGLRDLVRALESLEP